MSVVVLVAISLWLSGLNLGASDGGANWVSQNKGGAKSLSVCASTHEARGVQISEF